MQTRLVTSQTDHKKRRIKFFHKLATLLSIVLAGLISSHQPLEPCLAAIGCLSRPYTIMLNVLVMASYCTIHVHTL